MKEMATPIITIDHKYSLEDLKFVLSIGIRCFRLNPARIGIENSLQVYSLVKDIEKDTFFFFDTAGNKQRIKKQYNDKDDFFYVRILNGESRDAYFFISSMLFKETSKGDILVLRGNEKIELLVEEKNGTVITARFILPQRYEVKDRTHVYIKNKYMPCEHLNQIDKNIIETFKEKGTICLSFADSPAIAREARDMIGKSQLFAKIESPVGMKNALDILEHVDGIVVGRDDLTAFYTPSEIHRITQHLINLCYEYNKISVPASNYFLSLLTAGTLNEEDRGKLRDVMYCSNYIYINETVMNKEHGFIKQVINNF
ncbi:hypothetical protein JHL18_11790 [Clostridium sp. YIM B02505]|uniref:pyruvate kinase n=1 Tax=Clostridium yunnanense TaxID=2800325 RepID=A0ABS1EPS9_9CLOT|nr:pyruvate kinase [Clostridium yunnanense]MBK1811308.1 hypothetical protein [Clostridium yunnanense]